MKVKFRVKSKKVLAIILVAITVFCNGFKPTNTYAQESNSNTRIEEMTNQRKVIDVKRNTGTSTNITINGRTYKARKMNMKCTAYCNDPITATGVKPRPMHTVAIDPSLIKYGTKIYIPYFNTIFTCEDCGGKIKGNRLDIYMHTYNECMQFGIKNLDVYILE